MLLSAFIIFSDWKMILKKIRDPVAAKEESSTFCSKNSHQDTLPTLLLSSSSSSLQSHQETLHASSLSSSLQSHVKILMDDPEYGVVVLETKSSSSKSSQKHCSGTPLLLHNHPATIQKTVISQLLKTLKMPRMECCV